MREKGEVKFWIVFDLHSGEVRVQRIMKKLKRAGPVSTAAGCTAGFSVRDLKDVTLNMHF